MVDSNTVVQVRLVSGSKAVYRVAPAQAEFAGPASREPLQAQLARRAREYGTQVAHELNGQWFQPGGWRPVTDARVLALIEQAEAL